MIKKIFILLVSVCVFVFPSLTFAVNTTSISASTSNYSEEELVALISKLQKQLVEVRKNKVQCVLADVDLSIGDGEGDGMKEYVKGLQNFLKEKGYLKSDATGYFGKLTRSAVTSFQKESGLEQTGEINASTRASIKNLKCKKDYFNKKSEVKEAVKNTTVVSSITASVNGNTVKWSTVGYSKNGYKIVWSKNSNPTYPNRDGDKYVYLSEPSTSSTTLEAFNGAGTYYVKVCEYLGGSCGMYSNEVTISL